MRTHTALDKCWLNPASENRKRLWFRGFELHNSAYCCQPWPTSPLLYPGMGTSVPTALRQRLSFALDWQRAIVQLEALNSDVTFPVLGISVMHWKLAFWAVTQPHRWDKRSKRGRQGGALLQKIKSIICWVLGNDYPVGLPPSYSSFYVLQLFSPSFCESCDGCPSALSVSANVLIRWHDRPHILQAHWKRFHVPAPLLCVQSTVKNKMVL